MRQASRRTFARPSSNSNCQFNDNYTTMQIFMAKVSSACGLWARLSVPGYSGRASASHPHESGRNLARMGSRGARDAPARLRFFQLRAQPDLLSDFRPLKRHLWAQAKLPGQWKSLRGIYNASLERKSLKPARSRAH